MHNFTGFTRVAAPTNLGESGSAGFLVNLSTLRAIAAMAVVYYHITSEAGLGLGTHIGTRGVDIFFVISGFIITYVGTRDASQFMLRRLIRIVPFYWAATIGIFCLSMIAPGLLRSTRPDVVQLLCSLLFIPRETVYAGMFPTLVLGWSLNYEIYFYVLFALALCVSRRLAPVLCAGTIVAIMLLIDASGIRHPSVVFYARPIVLEFIYGILAFYALRWMQGHGDALRRFASGKWLLLLGCIGALAAIFAIENAGGLGLPRQIGAGIPAFAIVLSALLVDRIYAFRVSTRLLYLLGESSYILYLIHPYIVYGLLRTLFRHLDTGNVAVTGLVVVCLMAVSGGCAIACHLLFEKPVMDWLRRKLIVPGRSTGKARMGQPGTDSE